MIVVLKIMEHEGKPLDTVRFDGPNAAQKAIVHLESKYTGIDGMPGVERALNAMKRDLAIIKTELGIPRAR